MDQNTRLEAKTSKEEIRITILMDLQEVFPHHFRISLQDQFSQMGTTIRTMEDHMINAQISHSTETMEVDLQLGLSKTRMGTGETMENFLVLRRLKGETSHKFMHTANQEVINLTVLPSADLTIDLRLVLRLTNNNSHKTKTTPPNVVRFTAADDTIKELSDICPLNF